MSNYHKSCVKLSCDNMSGLQNPKTKQYIHTMNLFSDTPHKPNSQIFICADQSLKPKLLQAFQILSAFNRSLAPSCREWQEKLLSGRLTIATAGQFSRGKTSLVNALLREELLPTSVTPSGSIALSVVYGERLSIAAHFQDGSLKPISQQELADFLADDEPPRLAGAVREVRVAYPSPLLKPNLHLLDAPGIGSIHQTGGGPSLASRQRGDIVLFLLSADQLPGQAELDYLRSIKRHGLPVFFLLNKIDYLGEKELLQALAFSRQALARVMGSEVKLFPVSAKQALRGRHWAGSDLWEKSRIGPFLVELEDFLLRERDHILLSATTDALAELLLLARLEMGLECRPKAGISGGRRRASLEKRLVKLDRIGRQVFAIQRDSMIR